MLFEIYSDVHKNRQILYFRTENNILLYLENQSFLPDYQNIFLLILEILLWIGGKKI